MNRSSELTGLISAMNSWNAPLIGRSNAKRWARIVLIHMRAKAKWKNHQRDHARLAAIRTDSMMTLPPKRRVLSFSVRSRRPAGQPPRLRRLSGFARPRVRFRFLSFKTPPEKPTHYTTSAAKRNGTGAGNLVDPPARIRAPRTVRRLHNLGRAGQAKSSPLFRFPDFGPEYTGGLFPPAFSPVAGRFMVKWREDLSDGGAKAMIDLALAREQAALLAAAMERHSPVRELEDGYALFRDKRVTHAWKDRFNIVHAIVRTEEGDRKLQIDLDFFLASECGCSR